MALCMSPVGLYFLFAAQSRCRVLLSGVLSSLTAPHCLSDFRSAFFLVPPASEPLAPSRSISIGLPFSRALSASTVFESRLSLPHPATALSHPCVFFYLVKTDGDVPRCALVSVGCPLYLAILFSSYAMSFPRPPLNASNPNSTRATRLLQPTRSCVFPVASWRDEDAPAVSFYFVFPLS